MVKAYKVEQYDLSRGATDLEEKLNKMLSDGWELVTVTSHNIFIFIKIVNDLTLDSLR